MIQGTPVRRPVPYLEDGDYTCVIMRTDYVNGRIGDFGLLEVDLLGPRGAPTGERRSILLNLSSVVPLGFMELGDIMEATRVLGWYHPNEVRRLLRSSMFVGRRFRVAVRQQRSLRSGKPITRRMYKA